MNGTAFLSLLLTLATAGAQAHAYEVMDESEMADEVARDGITFSLLLPDLDGAGPGTDMGLTVAQTIWHDKNGLPGRTTPGAVVHGSGLVGDRLEISMAAYKPIIMRVDSVGDSSVAVGVTPMLNLNLSVPALTIKSGSTYVGRSNGTSAAVTNLSAAISGPMTINLGAFTANVQLANEAQGYMAYVDAVLAGGITATGYKLNDVVGGGSLSIATITLHDHGGSDLTLKAGVDIAANGMVFSLVQLGAVGSGLDASLSAVKLGDGGTSAIGNVDIVGLNLASTLLRIVGH